MDFADPPFPRSVSYWWFGCNSESNGGNHDNNGWFLSGSYPGLSEVSDGDGSQIHSLRVQTDPLRSDVDDLILDAGEKSNKVENLWCYLNIMLSVEDITPYVNSFKKCCRYVIFFILSVTSN